MKFEFYKYQGTGNDFVMIDDRAEKFPAKDTAYIAQLCDRRFGIGADGLILIQKAQDCDFTMVYFNADGREGSLCGNGARCTIAFAQQLGIIEQKTRFRAADGLHKAEIHIDGTIALHMLDVGAIRKENDHVFMDTGSPHHVAFVENLAEYPVVEKGRSIRYGAPYNNEGTNVNFVQQIAADSCNIRTYERGVEDETLSCGTGATAVALALHALGKTVATKVTINVPGGQLAVRFTPTPDGYQDIYLMGPAQSVFQGEVVWKK